MNFNEARRIASNNMQEAMVAEFRGNAQEALRFYEIAFEAEEQAALLCSEKDCNRLVTQYPHYRCVAGGIKSGITVASE